MQNSTVDIRYDSRLSNAFPKNFDYRLPWFINHCMEKLERTQQFENDIIMLLENSN